VSAIARAFVAVVPPADVLDAVEDAARPLRLREPALRFVGREQWHVTLQFLGRVPDDLALSDALGSALTTVAPFDVRLGGVGAFPSVARAAVLWIGVAEGSESFGRLAAAVCDASASLGFAAEDRPFHAHLTVARAGRPRRVAETVTAFGVEPLGPRWTVDSVALVASDTRRDGAVYTEVARFPLSG